MYARVDRKRARLKVRRRIRGKISGTAERPRLCVYRSLKHIYAQAVDDTTGRTLAFASTREKEIQAQQPYGGNVAAARLVGRTIAQRLLALGVEKVVFDRGGFRYHGRVKALADAAREGGLKF
ncbi:MAG: 50S ribosomal protein L18 [Acidobacteria bacterium]|nr:MAG: 50S ribosomal protein L18 [Acidobacteriota bacterium]